MQFEKCSLKCIENRKHMYFVAIKRVCCACILYLLHFIETRIQMRSGAGALKDLTGK